MPLGQEEAGMVFQLISDRDKRVEVSVQHLIQ
jgi:hypothetical protein